MEPPSTRLESMLGLARATRKACRHAFILLWHPAATEDAAMRIAAFSAGANMVSCYPDHVGEALRRLASLGGPRGSSSSSFGAHGADTGGRTCACAWCGQSGLTADGLWLHQPLYHIYDTNRGGLCSVCGARVANLAVHIHEEHAPGGPQREVRSGLAAAVVVHRRRDNRFLMVQEFAGQGYWVPGGGTDFGETVRASAVRECLEEAGVKVELQGLAEVDYIPGPQSTKPVWRLAVFYATVEDGDGGGAGDGGDREALRPKTVPCFESAGACWVGPEELRRLPLRSSRVPELWFPYFAAGGSAQPLEEPSEELRGLFEAGEY